MTRITSCLLLSKPFEGPIRNAQVEITFHAGGAVSDDQFRLHNWRIALHDLIHELDREKINKHAQNVQRLIFERFQQLDKEGDSEAERQALKEALTTVRIIMGDHEGREENKARE
jgi:hypothetical protein